MILSVSRRTDIPAFFSEWFFKRIREGFLMVRNPMNYHQVSKIPLDPQSVDCFVFWSKNPSKMLNQLDKLKEYNYYFLFTITSYSNNIEVDVPRKHEIIDTYKRLVDTIGPNRVVWRYDPILLSGQITEEYHYKWFEYLADKLKDYASKCVISFLDDYKKCQRNMKHIALSTIDDQRMLELCTNLCEIGKNYNISLSSCAEDNDLQRVGVISNKCIDPDLIAAICSRQVVACKDKNQRSSCGCIASIDVGTYNTCSHHCLYCYANFNVERVNKNLLKHDPESPLLLGNLENTDKVTTRKMESCFASQGHFSY